MKHTFLLVPVLALFTACGDGKSDAAERMSEVADSTSAPAAATMDLAQYGVPLMLTPPEAQLLQGAEVAVTPNENTGKLEVKAGDHFGLTIVEEAGDLQRLKGDLDRDQLKTNAVLKETPDMLVYKSTFPDDQSIVFVHFYQVLKSGDRSFIVEDVQGGMRFNEQDVERMAQAVSVKQPA